MRRVFLFLLVCLLLWIAVRYFYDVYEKIFIKKAVQPSQAELESPEFKEEIFIKKVAQPSRAELESPEFKLFPYDPWRVVHRTEVKKGNRVIVKMQQFAPKDLGIDDPESISHEELEEKFLAFDQKRREDAEKPKCVIQECHGLDISCGFSQGNQVCTKEYRLGDFCRAFTGCEIIDGECRLRDSENFEACKSCVEDCQNQDLMTSFGCERQCRKRFPYGDKKNDERK